MSGLQEVMETQTVFHFFASSILFVYEGFEVPFPRVRPGKRVTLFSRRLLVRGPRRWVELYALCSFSGPYASRHPDGSAPMREEACLLQGRQRQLAVKTAWRWPSKPPPRSPRRLGGDAGYS